MNSVQPGLHATARMLQLYGGDPEPGSLGIPAGIIGDPADFGQVMAFLCSAGPVHHRRGHPRGRRSRTGLM